MLIFFSIWGAGTLFALLFLEGPWQFLLFIGSAWFGIWYVARKEDDGSRWGDERAKRSGETRGG
jgi:hypothetical protein